MFGVGCFSKCFMVFSPILRYVTFIFIRSAILKMEYSSSSFIIQLFSIRFSRLLIISFSCRPRFFSSFLALSREIFMFLFFLYWLYKNLRMVSLISLSVLFIKICSFFIACSPICCVDFVIVYITIFTYFKILVVKSKEKLVLNFKL